VSMSKINDKSMGACVLVLCAILFPFLSALLMFVAFLRHQNYDPFFFLHTLTHTLSSPIPIMLLINCVNPLHGQTPTIYYMLKMLQLTSFFDFVALWVYHIIIILFYLSLFLLSNRKRQAWIEME